MSGRPLHRLLLLLLCWGRDLSLRWRDWAGLLDLTRGKEVHRRLQLPLPLLQGLQQLPLFLPQLLISLCQLSLQLLLQAFCFLVVLTLLPLLLLLFRVLFQVDFLLL